MFTALSRSLTVVLILLIAPLTSWAEQADFSAYGRLLERHVSAGTASGITLNTVDYRAWAADLDYPMAIQALNNAKPSQLESRNERLSFWINSYNLLAIKTVIDTGVSDSIKDAGSFFSPVWVRNAGQVGGQVMSLDEIEHEILRPMGDPRVHMAVVCASLSCPDLRAEAYRADKLDAQLDDQARKFLANPTKGLRADNGHLTVSKIFDWFEEDFDGGVLGFIRNHADVPEQSRINDHFDYDWSLNGKS